MSFAELNKIIESLKQLQPSLHIKQERFGQILKSKNVAEKVKKLCIKCEDKWCSVLRKKLLREQWSFAKRMPVKSEKGGRNTASTK